MEKGIICNEEKPYPRKSGILNAAFISSEYDVENGNSLPIAGSRYMSNLREFNRKMSSVARPAVIMVETERKLIQHGLLERKKSSSLSSLSSVGIHYDELCSSGSQTPRSGRSSLTGSRLSLRSHSLDGSESSEQEIVPRSSSDNVEVGKIYNKENVLKKIDKI